MAFLSVATSPEKQKNTLNHYRSFVQCFRIFVDILLRGIRVG
jgi:hypothetical protein